MIDIIVKSMNKNDFDLVVKIKEELAFSKIDKIFFKDLEYLKVDLGDFSSIFGVIKDIYDHLMSNNSLINNIINNNSNIYKINYKKQLKFITNIELLFSILDKYELKDFTIVDINEDQHFQLCEVQKNNKLQESIELTNSVMFGLITNSIFKKQIALNKNGFELIKSKLIERIKIK